VYTVTFSYQLSDIYNFIIIIKYSDTSFISFQLSNIKTIFTDLNLLSALENDLNLKDNKTLYNSSYCSYNR